MPGRRDADALLIDAILGGDAIGVRRALAAGADANAILGGSETVLMRAVPAERGDEMVRILLARGARVDQTDDTGRTALHHAACAGRLEVARALLERGARVDARASGGDTPLDFALRISHDLPLIDLLRARMGAKAAPAGRALAVAAIHGDHARAWKLIAEGVDVAALTEALRGAAQIGDVALARGLIDAGALPGGDERGEPPLHRAAWHGRAAAARLLLDAGADVNSQARSHGLTPLQVAVRTGHAQPAAIVETVRLLLDAGADALILDRDGCWPRATARSLGRGALVAMLPAAADERPIDASADGVAKLVLGSAGDLEASFRPNNVVLPFAVVGGYSRDYVWGHDCDAGNALGRHREDFERANAAWAFPIMEAMRDGRWPAYAEVEAAYRIGHGREPQVRRFGPWAA